MRRGLSLSPGLKVIRGKLEFAPVSAWKSTPFTKLPRDAGARSAPCVFPLDNPGMTPTVASWSNAGHPRDHIAASAVHYKIGEIQSVSTHSKWRTLRLRKEDLNNRFELLVLP